MKRLIVPGLLSLSFLASSCAKAAPTTKPTGKPAKEDPPQQECLHETNPASPRHTKLHGDKPTNEIIRWSVENDGHPDVLERWWMGKRCRWIDENHDMKSTDVRGDMSADSLQVDCDGDGYYDGPGDMNVKWVDDDGDGRADAEIVTINPSSAQKTIHGGSAHYMVFIDVDHDGVNAYIDWMYFDWTKAELGNWRYTGKGDFSPDYNGDAIFLKQHLPAWASADPRFSWENPFAFFDTDNDGCTEMSIRLLDTATHSGESKVMGEDPPKGTKPTTIEKYTGKDNEAYISYDIDNSSTIGNEMSYDMTLKFMSSDPKHPGELLDYSKFSDKHKIRAPQWVLDAHLYRYDNYRRIDDWCYVPHDKCYDQIWPVKWGQCWFVFDEDNDDHRWERVELYDPDGDPYSVARLKDARSDHSKAGLSSNGQADSLGDRGEWDRDNSGRGKLYIGRWDQKIHLYGAERGAWTVDYGAKYWGAGPVVTGGSSRLNAPKVGEVVQYRDTDNNGFFDEITYDYTGNHHVDLKINLLDYKDADHPHPDEQPLLDPGQLKWQGMHDMFTKISQDSFQQALQMYRAAWKAGLTDHQLNDLAIAASTMEKYDHGYWLKEKIFRKVDQMLADNPTVQAGFRKAYFLGDYPRVVQIISELPGQHDDINAPPPYVRPTPPTTAP